MRLLLPLHAALPTPRTPGIMFQDITTLLLNPVAYKDCIDLLVERYRGAGLDVIAGFEARGFFFGPGIALALQLPFVPLRKPRKLPGAWRGGRGTQRRPLGLRRRLTPPAVCARTQARSSASRTSWSTAPTRWRCTWVPCRPGSACCSLTTSSPPAARSPPARASCAARAPRPWRRAALLSCRSWGCVTAADTRCVHDCTACVGHSRCMCGRGRLRRAAAPGARQAGGPASVHSY
jgi:hypothetical protein